MESYRVIPNLSWDWYCPWNYDQGVSPWCHLVPKNYQQLSPLNLFFLFLLIFIYVEKEMATHSSILAWRIPWMEDSSGLWSMGSQRVGHDWATNTHLFMTTPCSMWELSSPTRDGTHTLFIGRTVLTTRSFIGRTTRKSCPHLILTLIRVFSNIEDELSWMPSCLSTLYTE